MNKNNFSKKAIVLGIIILFVGASIVPSISGIINEKEKVSSILNDGLVGYWKLNEGSGNIAYDSSGQNNNGTVSGAKWIGGINGTALYIDGIDDYVDCRPTLTGTVLSEVTVEAWIYPKNAGYIFYDGSDGEFSIVRMENGTARFWVKLSDGYPGYYLYSNSILESDAWHHIAGVYNYSADVTKIFVNGQLENTKTIPHLSLYNPSGDYYPTIGAYSSSTNAHWYQFNGTIDEVRVYNRTLKDEEILEHYEEYFPLMEVYVNDDYNSSTPGWGFDHFDKIQDGIDAVMENGTVYVYNGTYYENVVVDKTINLIGEDKDNTIIDGGGDGNVVYISANAVSINGFTMQNSGSKYSNAGLYIRSDCNNIIGNEIVCNEYGIYLIDSCNNNIFENVITNNNDIGIYLSHYWYSSDNNSINDNIIVNNYRGIKLHGSSYNTITGNTITDHNQGNIALFAFSNNNIFSKNIIANATYSCFSMFQSSNNTIIMNNIANNGWGGIDIWEACNNTIAENFIVNNGMEAIVLFSLSNGNIIFGNTFSNNDYGIELHNNTVNNNLFENTIINNSQYGIYLWEQSNNNKIYHNNIINNTQNAYDVGNNAWDNDYPSGGNYWDDYSGQDNFSGPNQDIHGADGIGDIPYHIYGDDSHDWYPLMKYYKPDAILSVIDINPNTLNLKSKGKWITCYIELPDGYGVADIDISTILMNNEIPAEPHPTNISDYDNDGVSDLMVKFDRQVVQDILEPGSNVEITVTGKLFDETLFEGIDYIRVI